jgi:hypothetical protein
MTIHEAAKRGVRRLRLPQWNEYAFCEISIANGLPSAFATIYDPCSMIRMGKRADEPVVLPLNDWFDGTDWEPRTAPGDMKRFFTPPAL